MKRAGLAVAFTVTISWLGLAHAADGGVARAQFTTGIDNREPVDMVEQVDTSHNRIVFFTELQGLEGHTVTHRWMHGGRIQGEVEFEVGGPRWRVWSSKDLLPQWTGPWTVVVLDDQGGNLGLWDFVYTEQPEEMNEEPAQSE